ncbi:helix-turn-helix domain-containing protein [Nocardiopsis lucentensis]|uniref:helix-turn-helix domain-containing protein n=1 Tax=Nocardiopsis lucentensis TaxID=53441 RepID=UPI00034D3478|nr:helix-turn-helix transcriptional regulator [Nocardiopsis lucentensis]
MTDLHLVPEEDADEPQRATPLPLRYYASELKRYREAAGLTQEQLSNLIPYSKSMISMVETAKRSPLEARGGEKLTSRFTDYCDQVLDTGGALSRILPLLEDAGDPYPSWFRPYANLEAEATAIYIFQSQTVPGLLQTEEYAQELARCLYPAPSETEVGSLVTARMQRQEILGRTEPPHLFFVIDEAVLKRRIGTASVMRQQLQRLMDVSQWPTVNLLIMPFSVGGHPAIDGSHVILDLPEGESALYVEGPGSATITTVPSEVRPAQLRFLALCGAALPSSLSVEMIEKYMGET